MATGAQMVLEVKKNKLNNSLHLNKKLDCSFKLRYFCVHIFILKILIF